MSQEDDFFTVTIPAALSKLRSDSRPEWGSMDAAALLNHLTRGLDMSLNNQDGEISVSADKLPGYRKFLMSDKPFGRNLRQPAYFESSKYDGDFEELRRKLLGELKKTFDYLRSNQDHHAVHPSFGELNSTEWLQLHRKHFHHHLYQFNLIHD